MRYLDYQEFPKFKYHATEAPRIVNDPAEEEALGPAWHDTVVAAIEAAESVAPKPKRRKEKFA